MLGYVLFAGVMLIPLWFIFGVYTGHWSNWRGEGFSNKNAPDWCKIAFGLLDVIVVNWWVWLILYELIKWIVSMLIHS